MEAHQAADLIRVNNDAVVDSMNEFCEKTFTTRGGRKGSGMGLLLEGLWGYTMTQRLIGTGLEIAWIADDAYNDYACVRTDADWDPDTGEGELFRIEAKSMNLGADESKAHFDELATKIGEDDLLLVLTWTWAPISGTPRVCPRIAAVFIDRARELALLRDELHIARGGSFVSASSCPDGCDPSLCQHDGEPLNAAGIRERRSGPVATKGSNVSYAANFGGLVRMVKTGTRAAAATKQRYVTSHPIAQQYIEFINESTSRKVSV